MLSLMLSELLQAIAPLDSDTVSCVLVHYALYYNVS